MRKSILALCLAVLFMVGSAMAAIESSVGVSNTYTPNAYEPDPYIIENVTITDYENSSTTALDYEDDGGDDVTIPGTTQKIYLNPSKIVSPLGLQKPIADGSTNGTVWRNVSGWTNLSDTTGGAISLVTESGVEKLKISIAGKASGTGNYMVQLPLNANITDLTKKYFVIGVEVTDAPDYWDGGYSYVNVQLVDRTSGGYYFGRVAHSEYDLDSAWTITAGTGRALMAIKVTDLSNSSAPSQVDAIKIANMDTNSSGATSISYKIFALGVEDKLPSFGKLNDVTVHQILQSKADSSPVMVLDTFKPSFKWEKVTTFGPVTFKMKASDLAAKHTTVKYEELSTTQKADYTKEYAVREYFNFTFELPEAIDLSYDGNGVLKDVLTANSQQYDYVTVTSGTADPVQKTTIYTGARKGDTVTLLSSMVDGTAYKVYLQLLLTQSQWEGISEEAGALYGDSDAWWNEWWLWLAGLLGTGAWIKRKRKGGA